MDFGEFHTSRHLVESETLVETLPAPSLYLT
jgi:hypothetical protein